MSETRQGMRFAAVLHATRRAAGLSYRRLAKASEISHSFLSHVEKGERRAPPAKAVLALADALDADHTTFALAAIADRAGGDVATTMAMALQRGPVGRDVDPTAGGVLIESGPEGAEAQLDDLGEPGMTRWPRSSAGWRSWTCSWMPGSCGWASAPRAAATRLCCW